MRGRPGWHSTQPMTPEETRARLLYRDGLMLILDKPAGVAVHRGPKGGASLEDDFDALRFGLPRKPALAHRLDRETAGCLILGRHHKALETLGLLFKQGKIAKTYWAVVAGAPEGEEGAIDLPLGRLDDKRGWWMKVDPNGQKALTLWQVKGRGIWRGAPIAWLELKPQTGRTHQLRVHCAAGGLADPRRCDLWRAGRDSAATLGAKGRRAALKVEAADRSRGAGAAAHAGDAGGLRLCGRSAPDRNCGQRRRRRIVGAVADHARAIGRRNDARLLVGLESAATGGRLCGAADCERSRKSSRARALGPCRSEPPSIT